MGRATFLRAVGVVSVTGTAVRVGYAFAYRRHAVPTGDALYYHTQANLLVAGKGFVNPYDVLLSSHYVPSASHPPLWTLLLALASLLGLKGVFGQILWGCVIGGLSLPLVAGAGAALGGRRVGILAVAVAAFYPNFVVDDGSLMAETLEVAVAAALLWAAYRLWRRPTPGAAVVLGAACGLAALTRSELVLLVPLVGAGTALVCRIRPGRRLALAALALVAGAAVMTPWLAYNAARLSGDATLSTNLGVTLATANCPATYSGPLIGYWSFSCPKELGVSLTTGTETEQDARLRKAAVSYAEHHTGRLPAVVGARLGRELGLYAPWQQITLEWTILERPRLIAALGLGAWYLACLLAVPGALELRRRGVTLLPLAVTAVTVLVVAAATFGQTRYRTSLDVVVVILAAVGLERLAGAGRSRRGRSALGAGDDVGLARPRAVAVSQHAEADQDLVDSMSFGPAQ